MAEMGEAEELRRKLRVAIDAFRDERIRWFVGKSRDLVDSGLISLDKMDELVRYLLRDEMERHAIMREIEESGPLTASELAEKTGISLERVEEHVRVLCVVGELLPAGEKGGSVAYALKAPVEEIMSERRICPCETVVALLNRVLGLW
ncbi:hypothetical protein DRO32_05260, partial [Candidatus Bathyarchaeota archaeon]